MLVIIGENMEQVLYQHKDLKENINIKINCKKTFPEILFK